MPPHRCGQPRKGLTVAGVRGPAELAGLKPKDIVVQVDDQPTTQDQTLPPPIETESQIVSPV